ncbi:MAG: cell division protein FtsQ/DivIB [Hyphomicrobiales bacterium]
MNTNLPRIHSRRRHAGTVDWLAFGQRKRVRFAARAGAVAFLAATIFHGLLLGGYLDHEGGPWRQWPGRIAGFAGLAADDIKIEGLINHTPEAVLAAINVKPGGSLIGFDALQARRILENIDWVASAKVQRLFPNQLEIAVVERVPFAVWQRGKSYYAIDRNGAAMSGIPSAALGGLPLISGEGAQTAAAGLVNQLEAVPALKAKIRAAARMGMRRWTLYLDNGVTILLPERDVEAALALAEKLDSTQGLLSKGIASLDLRLADRITVAVAEVPPGRPGER